MLSDLLAAVMVCNAVTKLNQASIKWPPLPAALGSSWSLACLACQTAQTSFVISQQKKQGLHIQ